jgi:membrane-bound metal-dependent hydrolase YbcI (DUF457 family)
MEGRSHALSGAVAGAGLSLAFLHADSAEIALAAVLTAGAAVLPDLDHPDSSIARTFGFVTEAFAWVVEKLSGGHRHLTHSLAGAGIFTALVWLAGIYRHTWPGKIGLGFALTLLLAAALRALKIGGHAADLIAVAGAVAVVWYGYRLALVPYAVAAGCVTHVIGDGLTDQGVPLWAPLTGQHVHLLPEPFAFTTGTRPERWVVVPVLYLALAWIALTAAGLAIHVLPAGPATASPTFSRSGAAVIKSAAWTFADSGTLALSYPSSASAPTTSA